MSISGWWASRRQRKLEAYDKNYAYATAEEQQQLKRRGLFRRRLDLSITGAKTTRQPHASGVASTRCSPASKKEVTMSYASFTDAISASHSATDRIMRGDAGGFKDLYSRSGDITLGNPFGGFGQGSEGVFEQLDRAASYFSDGRAAEFEQFARAAADELAYTVEIERVEVKVAGRTEVSEFAARVTSVYRREEDGWKLIHRHADPRVSRQTADSVLQT